jgi:excisionase family DNA binding protein
VFLALAANLLCRRQSHQRGKEPAMTERQRETLSIEEAAGVLKVGVPTVEELIAQGVLNVRQEGDEDCVLYADLLAYLRQSHRASTEDGEAPANQLDVGLV